MNNIEELHCRLCAQTKPQNKLFDLKMNQEKWQEVVSKLDQVNVKLDMDTCLPQTVCFTCDSSLDKAFNFISAVQQAQITLNDLILVRPVVKKESDSDEEMFTYEPPDDSIDIDYKEDIVKIYKAEELIDSTEVKKKSCTKNVKIKTENTITLSNDTDVKQKKNMCNSLDSLPLSQLKLSWSDYNWLCSFCDTQFPTVDELRIHSMKYHNACNPYRCTDCRRRKVRLNSFLLHVKRHKKYLKFSCYKCLKKFSKMKEVSNHVLTHNHSEYICIGCNTNFSSRDELNVHTTQFVKGVALLNQQGLAKDDPLTCSICGKISKSKNAFNNHMLLHTDRKKDHTCEICGMCVYTKGNLKQHMQSHSDTRPYKCDICKASFKTSRYLRCHIGTHNTDKPFTCDQCGRCFRHKYQLKEHTVVHSDTLPHVCSYCSKGFRFRSVLAQHIRLHTGVKPYSCTICQRDFANWPNYNKHMKVRHNKDMSKTKRTPNGIFPVDPVTGQLILPEGELPEWKKKVQELQERGRTRNRKKKVDDLKEMSGTENNILKLGAPTT